MTTPDLFSGFLNQKARDLNIDKNTASGLSRLRLYRQTLIDIRDVLYRESLRDITGRFLEIVELDIRTIIDNLRNLELEYPQIKIVKEQLEKAYSELITALQILEDDSRESDSALRLKHSVDAIMNFRKGLDNTLEYWSADLLPLNRATEEPIAPRASTAQKIQESSTDKQEEYYRKAIERNPEDVQAYFDLGRLLAMQNRLLDAEEIYRSLIKQNPNFAETYERLGDVLRRLNRADESKRAYDKALEINSKNAAASKKQDAARPSDMGGSAPPPDAPNTNASDLPSPEQQPEPAETISQYIIHDSALEKHAATDKPIQDIHQDKLGFGTYVTALHDFIVSQYTTTPLTISIDGPWGTGKSSLMYMLKNSLEPQEQLWQRFVSWLKFTVLWWAWFSRCLVAWPAQVGGKALLRLTLRLDKNSQEFVPRVGARSKRFVAFLSDVSKGLSTAPEVLKQQNAELTDRARWWATVHAQCEPMEVPYHPTIWLNAWKFDNQEEVWASLALATLEQLKQKHNIFWMIWFRIQLTFKRMPFLAAVGMVLLQFVLPVILGVIALYYSVIIASYGTPLKAVNVATKGYGNYLFWAGAILSGILTVKSVFKDPFQIPVGKILDRPSYKEKISFLTGFEKDFARIIDLATRNGFGWKRSKLVIFVDDLDRCEPPKAADIIEAVNLFLDAEGCVFVVGMDSESVSKSIEVKYKDLFERMTAEKADVVSLGKAFLDKIVQIPFTMPRATPDQILSMVEATLGRKITERLTIAQPKDKSHDTVQEKGKPPSIQSETVSPKESTVTKDVETLGLKEQVDPASFAREEVRQAIHLGTSLLSENPRQVKTFVNLFRLSIYIANARGFFEERRKGAELKVIGLTRLAVWIVCSIRWPGLVRRLYADNQTRTLRSFLETATKSIVGNYPGDIAVPGKTLEEAVSMRKVGFVSNAHWSHLPWEWWLIEPDFLKALKLMEDLWAPPQQKEIDWLKVLLTMTKPISQ